MSTPNNTDLLLVERGGSQYKLPYSDLNNKLDTDVFLVERDGVQYKILGEFIGGSSVGTVSAAPVLSDNNDSKVPAVITVTNATVGNATLTSSVWLKDGVVIAGATGSTYSATDPGVYSIKQTWTDGLGNTFQVEAQLTLLTPPAYVDDLFSTFLYEGTNDPRTIENGIDLSGEGGLVWIKSRGPNTNDHVLVDTERGSTKYLASNTTSAEVTNSETLTSFTSNGFTLGGNSIVNGYEKEIASWAFRKAPGFFDVVTYTGASGNQTISHNLGSEPGMILVKNLSDSYEWSVYHRSLGNGKRLRLNTDQAEETNSNYWPSAPTSTTFTVGTDGSNGFPNNNYVAYIFAHNDQSFGANGDEAIIKCGTYTGTGGSGLNVDLGFEAQFVLVKNINNNGSNWIIFDNMRGMDDGRRIQIYPNSNEAEFSGSTTPGLVATASGFKSDLGNSWFNQSGSTHIYMAIRRSHKPPTVGTDVFAADYFTGSVPGYVSNFPVDFVINREGLSNDGNSQYVADRLRGGKFLKSESSNAEISSPAATFDHMNGFGSDTSGNTDKVAWMFKRASGFMDMVSYTGTGSARTLSHNLDVAPELMIVKAIDRSESWPVYISSVGETGALYFNSAGDVDTGNYYWNDTAPTAQQFSLGTLNAVNRNGTKYIAYLFSTLPGISKVGSFTGTGYQIDVDCGFTTAARFLMIKRKSGSGDWYVWDTERGLFGPPEPYLALNSSNAQVTGYDYVDPYSAGFTVTSTAPAEINAAGEEYVFLAIA